jgi:hypothetical protein
MAVTMGATIKRFVGLSTDAKPIDDRDNDQRVPNGSTFLEEDTGDMYIYTVIDGWYLKDEASITLRLETKDLLEELLEVTRSNNEYLQIMADKI